MIFFLKTTLCLSRYFLAQKGCPTPAVTLFMSYQEKVTALNECPEGKELGHRSHRATPAQVAPCPLDGGRAQAPINLPLSGDQQHFPDRRFLCLVQVPDK